MSGAEGRLHWESPKAEVLETKKAGSPEDNVSRYFLTCAQGMRRSNGVPGKDAARV